MVSAGNRVGDPSHAVRRQAKLPDSLALDAEDYLLSSPADCLVILRFLVAAR